MASIILFSLFLNIYLNVHGPGLNFIDVSLLTTLGLVVLGFLITFLSNKSDKQ